MASLTRFNRRFTPGWGMSVLALLVILLFLRLGFWQLARAEEKRQMLAAQSALVKQPPIPWQPGFELPLQYQPLKIQGHFLTTTLLLDNQHYNHQFGYHVISPFVLSDGKIVLVDRGWLAGDMMRRVLPDVNVPTQPLSLTGSAYYPSQKNWAFGELVDKTQANVTVIELIDTQLISQFLQKSVYPFIIRLSKDEANGYVRYWPVVAMSPERHEGYAVQWFAMALVIFILFIRT